MKTDFRAERKNLVEFMKSIESIKSREVEHAFLKTAREEFLPENLKEYAYADNAFPIGFNQTISQPSTIAIMLELLSVKKNQKVLEVGSGSGYVLALLSDLVGEKGKVFGVEIIPELAEISKKHLNKLKIKNAQVVQGDGSIGLKKAAPFDRILFSAAAPAVPEELIEQLNENGKIVGPTGDMFSQDLIIIEKVNGKINKKIHPVMKFMFVPMQGEKGFSKGGIDVT
ncbi:MAG TPA: protein-L-isoaspartate(D-aspartate) O-methyltransferase [archaeon]|nr:protein-L-isoaspartate(D-aspartate) O-methyltransferase [archaeon]